VILYKYSTADRPSILMASEYEVAKTEHRDETMAGAREYA